MTLNAVLDRIDADLDTSVDRLFDSFLVHRSEELIPALVGVLVLLLPDLIGIQRPDIGQNRILLFLKSGFG